MNRQRKVLITTTYNEMGIIIDTKAEEVTQPNLQPTCNQLATDCISRQEAIDKDTNVPSKELVSKQAVINEVSRWRGYLDDDMINRIQIGMKRLPSAQPDLPEAYAKKVWTWLLDYQTTAAELKEQYSAYEVLSWVVNDWRRGHGGLN